MGAHAVVSREDWLTARKALLAREKDFTRMRDEISAARRSLPWMRVDKDYRFQTPQGEAGLGDLFAGRRQLAVYHFMYGPDWQAGCKSCSFWADSYDGAVAHLKQRDVQLIAISRAPLDKLLAFRDRMGWSFPWVSSAGSDFNQDFGVSFPPGEPAPGDVYNYRSKQYPSEELPGFSAFIKDEEGAVYHTYSTYARGLDLVNSTYNILDMMPNGRGEDDPEFTMSWVRLHDEYEA